ncbi:MAG: 4Fe-4S dicluster domain-containing protein [Bacteroidales bacterium]|nr:4Fe-4S dicluster domain-containing protein [Bacteroidales bacterium]
MLRKTRITIAVIFFLGITLMFLDFTGGVHAFLGWMAKIQFLPAVLAANTLVVAGLVLVTALFGRVYCSVICPLGILQDIISWTRGRLKKKNRFRFRYTPEKKWLRYVILAAFVPTLALGAHSIAILIAPYSAYGRIAGNLFAPVYQWGNNLLAYIAERADSYAFYSTEVWLKSLPSLIVASVTLVVIFLFAWFGGRNYCNTVCPVGTILGFFSRRSIFAPVIDTEKCRNCGLCGRQCKSSCIDMENHAIDYSRCVVCMDCLDNCKEGAIKYALRTRRHGESGKNAKASDGHASPDGKDSGRRAFIATALLTGGALVSEARRKKIPALVRTPQKHERQTPVVPAGALSLKNFADRCTGCQLCVSACPNKVLRPSSSLETLLQPEMSYEKGYCRPECTACSDVCPAGAIRPVSIEEKSSIQIGHAVVNLDICVVNTDGVDCGNCARHCPAGAISMVRKNPQDMLSALIPAVDEERCIGCGACENLCPARPLSAIHVEGHEVHKMI